MSVLEVRKLSLALRHKRTLDEVSLQIKAGEFVGLLGANGAGKTSLMRASLGLIKASGHSSLAALSAAERARAVAWIPQAREILWPMSVERLVALGRLPHLSRWQRRLPAPDQALIDTVIQRLELEALRGQIASRLSGGEQARVLIARALVQEAPFLMADEAIAGLDPAYQIATMRLFAKLVEEEGYTVFVSLHDLGLAARYCSRLILLAEGRILADGRPAEVLTDELMARAFGISLWHCETPFGTFLQPLGLLP